MHRRLKADGRIVFDGHMPGQGGAIHKQCVVANVRIMSTCDEARNKLPLPIVVFPPHPPFRA